MTRLYKHEKVRMDIEERRDVTRFLALSTVVPQGIAEEETEAGKEEWRKGKHPPLKSSIPWRGFLLFF